MNIKKYASVGIVLAILGSLAIAVPALADTTNTPQNAPFYRGNGVKRDLMKPFFFGTVSNVNGNIITIIVNKFNRNSDGATTKTPATYTVDATSATIIKNNAAGTISSILVSDTISVQGTLTGTNIVATSIRDGIIKEGGGKGVGNWMASTTPIIQGNGLPIVAGTISAINSPVITITNKSNVTYTVDASNAKIVRGKNTLSISNLTVGDSVIVQGNVNGTSVTASSIIDQTRPASTTAGRNPTTLPRMGFFGRIGQFFAHLFGF